MSIEVLVPLSISGIWYPVERDNPLESGSIGLTLTLEPYVIAEIKRGNGIFLNDVEINFPNYNILKQKLGEYRLDVYSRVPLGYGYGLSGAISLAYALGASQIASINEEEAVNIAHLSEVLTSNGLGDVISQYHGGGLVYRKKPGGIGYGEIEVLKLDWTSFPIFTHVIQQMSTKNIIRKSDIALSLIDDFLMNPSPSKFIEVASRFTKDLGLISNYPYSYRKKGIIVKIFEPENGLWIRHKIANRGAYVT